MVVICITGTLVWVLFWCFHSIVSRSVCELFDERPHLFVVAVADREHFLHKSKEKKKEECKPFLEVAVFPLLLFLQPQCTTCLLKGVEALHTCFSSLASSFIYFILF